MPNSARLKIYLEDLDPAPWRIVDVPLSMNLTGLHRTIQAAFLWYDSHLWEFEIGDRQYGPMWVDSGTEPIFNPDNKRLTFLEKFHEEEFSYVYDMGDWWLHRVEVLELIDAPTGQRLPKFVDGAVCRPPEDIGGPPGYEHFQAVMADKNHPEHEDLLNGYGKHFDPNEIDREIIEIMMKREAAMRPAVK